MLRLGRPRASLLAAISALAMWCASVVTTAAPQASTFTVNITGAAAGVRCQFVVRGDMVRESATPGRVVINTAPNGTALRDLAFVYCPGFNIIQVDQQVLESNPARSMTVSPPLAATTHIIGLVEDDGRPQSAPVTIEVGMYGEWVIGDNATWDGAIPFFARVFVAALAADRTFEADIPNLERDPVARARFRHPGLFGFRTVASGVSDHLLIGSADPPIPAEMRPTYPRLDGVPRSADGPSMGPSAYLPVLDSPVIHLSLQAVPRR